MSIGRPELIMYLRWLADQPEGIKHRAWLFHAALLLRRDYDLVRSQIDAPRTGFIARLLKMVGR